MGLHGKQSNGPKKAPRRDARPHSSVRGITELSAPYFDLVNGGEYWTNPCDSEREAAWQVWRDRIADRWHRPGWRPDGWRVFDLPKLLMLKRPWRTDCPQVWADPKRRIFVDEYVWALRETSAEERSDIEELWRTWISNADEDSKPDVEFDPPAWFVDAERKATPS
ncbi:hypothetical protein NKH53_13760 [Mesorhizobium australicum]|uniref:hypothetical protein n=1 Tax=Mesorhizobium australicum TaxID=536018 RepID=UPI00333ABC75